VVRGGVWLREAGEPSAAVFIEAVGRWVVRSSERVATRWGIKSSTSITLDEAAAVEPVTEVLVEGVGLGAMVAASDLDAGASARPAKLLGSCDEQFTDATLPIGGGDNETGDAAKKALGVKERNTMKGDCAGDVRGGLRHEDRSAGRRRTPREALLDLRDRRRITESLHEFRDRRGIVRPRPANDGR
jgi:hypothetical protein